MFLGFGDVIFVVVFIPCSSLGVMISGKFSSLFGCLLFVASVSLFSLFECHWGKLLGGMGRVRGYGGSYSSVG